MQISGLIFNHLIISISLMLFPLLFYLFRQFCDKLFLYLILFLFPFFISSLSNAYIAYADLLQMDGSIVVLNILDTLSLISLILCPYISLLRILNIKLNSSRIIFISAISFLPILENIVELFNQGDSLIFGEVQYYGLCAVVIALFADFFLHRKKLRSRGLKNLFSAFFVIFIYAAVFLLFNGFLPGGGDDGMLSFFIGENLIYFAVLTSITVFLFLGYFKRRKILESNIPPGILAHYGISEREQSVIELIAAGYTSKEIGEKLFISQQTVKNHTNRIYRKMSINSKIELLNLLLEPQERT